MERPIVGGLANIGSFKSAFPRPSASLTAMETGRLILVKPPFQTKFYVCVWNYPMEFKTMKYYPALLGTIISNQILCLYMELSKGIQNYEILPSTP